MITQKIRRLRELRNYRQEYMAEQLGISQNAYSRLENGETKLDVERLRKIAEVLEVGGRTSSIRRRSFSTRTTSRVPTACMWSTTKRAFPRRRCG
jgi:transcriptional regulator with XRE-family HTH domain